MKNDFLQGLNPEQLKAVETIEGPVLVAAGPGTGKTQILAARIANILTKTDVPPDAVLALTFTESGVKAMRERLLGLIGPAAYYVNIATFHSFCSEIIQNYPDKFLLATDLEPLSDLQRLQIFRELLDKGDYNIIKPLGNPYLYVPALIKSIQDLKREGVLPEEFEQLVGSESFPVETQHVASPTSSKAQPSKLADGPRDADKQRELLTIYKSYQQILKDKGLFDFEDMINFVVQKFRDDEEFLRIFQERYQYILVDEFQDTNNAQNAVVDLLASYWDEPNVFVVGDANQSIYRFQGAAVENMVAFSKKYPTCQKITLTKNYRSTQTILDAATELISRNELRLSKIFPEIPENLIAATSVQTSKISVGEFSSSTSEVFYTAHKIKELLSNGVNPAEIAVIYRHNKDGVLIADTLARLGIFYNLGSGENVLEDPVIKKLLLLFRALVSSRAGQDDLDWFTLFNYEFLGFDSLDVLKLFRFASLRKINIIEAINHPEFEKASSVAGPEKFKKFLNDLVTWQKLDAESTLVTFFEELINSSGYLAWVLSLPDAYDKLISLNSLFSEVKKLSFATRETHLADLLAGVKVMQEGHLTINREGSTAGLKAVYLTTAHRAKGLEFEYVFILGCLDKKWGNNVNRDLIKLPEGILKNTDISKKEKNEDERRLFYVALTRAKKEVTITYSGGLPSMFLSEIDDNKKSLLDTASFEANTFALLKESLLPPSELSKTAVTDEERVFVQEVLSNFKLSVTALNTYLECAYKFKLNNILRTPRAKSPNLSLGTAVHAALDSFFKTWQSSDNLPTVDFLVNTGLAAVQKELLSPKDLKMVQRDCERILKHYFEERSSKFEKPLFTEKLFGYGWGKIMLEDIPLVGKVDRVDLIDKEKRLVRVVDYKTGKPQTRNEIEGNTKYSDGGYKRQLVFYRLLIDLDKTFNYEFGEATLDFVEDKGSGSRQESFGILPEEVAELKKMVISSMQKIRGLEFERTTNYKTCERCDYKDHCWPGGIPKAADGQLELLEKA